MLQQPEVLAARGLMYLRIPPPSMDIDLEFPIITYNAANNVHNECRLVDVVPCEMELAGLSMGVMRGSG
jgi:hypothetical protein